MTQPSRVLKWIFKNDKEAGKISVNEQIPNYMFEINL